MSFQHIINRICLGLLAVGFGNFEAAISATDNSIYWSTNAADAAVCEGHLNTIYSALQEYQKRNQNLPRWLSDLVPEYIHDPNALVCPYVLRTGNLKKVFTDPGLCSYTYEFCALRSPPLSTKRTYKERQMELMGFSVPIVRCLAHIPSLNLGFDGTAYPSPPSSGEWEDIFVISPRHESVFHRPALLTNIAQNQLVFKLAEPRKPETDARMLDLSLEYNALLLHLSQIDRSGKLLITYPEGVQRIAGIDFDVRGLVHLGARPFPIVFPEKIESIPVNRKCTSIHFLHGAASVATNGSRIASFLVHFQDGRTAKVPIIYGKDVKERWFYRNQKSDSPPGEAQPAWITPSDKVGVNGKALRLFVTSWTSPNPASEVASLDFLSHMTESAPFLLAITVE